jgi:putative hydrolase of the HAD superfamily
MRVQAIFFDLDDTLLDDERGWRISVSSTGSEIAGRHAGIDGNALAVAYAANSERLWRQFGAAPRTAEGQTSARELRLTIWRAVLAEFRPPLIGLAEEILHIYEGHRRANYSCFPEVVPLLERLASVYPMAVITNGPSEGQREKLAVTGLDRYFQMVVTSNDIGVGKPDQAIFRHALDGLGVEACGALHVGDSLEADVLGAHNTGLTAVWLNRRGAQREGHHPVPHHEIRSLSELNSLLEGA